jgi:hypothetical protein
MAKFHINAKGEAGKCSATQGGCPFGDESQHYTSPEAAREGYEKRNVGDGWPPKVTKSSASTAAAPKGEYDGWTADQLKERLTNWKEETPWDDTTNLEIALADAEKREAAPKESSWGPGARETVEQLRKTGDPKMVADFESLPGSYANALVSTHETKSHVDSNIKKLVAVGKAVHAAHPDFEVAQRSTRTPNQATARLQNVSEAGVNLLYKYAEDKYGERSEYFMKTLTSGGRNLPKISDFHKKEREWDKDTVKEFQVTLETVRTGAISTKTHKAASAEEINRRFGSLAVKVVSVTEIS